MNPVVVIEEPTKFLSTDLAMGILVFFIVQAFGIKNKGYIKEEYDADLTIVDMNKEQVIKDEMIASKCGWTPFNNYKVKGFPVGTIVNGNLVMSEGKVISKAQGQPMLFK